MNDNYFDKKRRDALVVLRATRDALDKARVNRTNKSFGDLESSYNKLNSSVSSIDKDFSSKFNALVKVISPQYINKNNTIKNLVTKGGLFSGGIRLNMNKGGSIKVRDMDGILRKLRALKADKNAKNKLNADEKKAREDEKRRLNAEEKEKKEKAAKNRANQQEKDRAIAKKEEYNRKMASIKNSLNKIEGRLAVNNGPREIELQNPVSIQSRLRQMNKNARTKLTANVINNENTMRIIRGSNLNSLKPQTLTALKSALNAST